MDSVEDLEFISPPNTPDFNILSFNELDSPLVSCESSSRSDYFFSPEVVQQFTNGPLYHSFSPTYLNSPLPELLPGRSQFFLNDDLHIDSKIFDKMSSPEKIYWPITTDDREFPSGTTSLAERNIQSSERTSLLTAPKHTAFSHLDSSVSIKTVSEENNVDTSFAVAETCGSPSTADHNDWSQRNDDCASFCNETNDSSLNDKTADVLSANGDLGSMSTRNEEELIVLASKEAIADSSSTNISPAKSETDSAGPPAKRKRKYKPRRHIPKTLNLRGRPRKIPVALVKASYDPVWDFMKTLPPYLLALNNFNPTEIFEYQQLLESKSLQAKVRLSEQFCDSWYQ